MITNMEEKKVLLEEADLLKIIGQLVGKWKFILVVTLCFAVLGMIIALGSAKSYTTEVVVAPEMSSSSSVSSGLNSLASMAGLDLGAEGGDAIYPLLYPDIINSLPFLTSLFDVKVTNIDGTADTTYYTYLKQYRIKTWLDYVRAFPKKMVKKVVDLVTTPDPPATPDFNPYMLSRNQMKMVESLKASIGVFVDKKTDVVTLSFTDRDPRVAAIMAETIMNRLQQEVTEYRTKKASDDCVYIEKMCLEAKDSLDVSQKRFAEFISHNRNIINEFVLLERERLAADKELKTALYTQWAQQLLLAKAKVQEITPVFVTLKPAAIPAIPSSMGRLVKMMMIAFLGAVFAVAYVLLKEPFFSVWTKITRKNEK